MAIQSRELQTQEPRKLKTGDEKIFSEVTVAPKIINRPLAELEQVLRFVMMKIGLRAENWPSQEEKAILIDHIISSYGNHTIEEIRLAFDMALSYKLGFQDKEILCYENFSCLYFSKIMNAYRVWAAEVYKYISHTPILSIDEKKELTKEEWDEWFVDIRKYDFKIIPCSAYDFLVKEGKINLTNAEKHDYMERSIAQLLGTFEASSKEMIDFSAMKKKGIYSPEITASLKTISKRFAIQDYLNKNPV